MTPGKPAGRPSQTSATTKASHLPASSDYGAIVEMRQKSPMKVSNFLPSEASGKRTTTADKLKTMIDKLILIDGKQQGRGFTHNDEESLRLINA